MTRSSVEVVIPFAPGCSYRERAFEWVRERYPWPVRVGVGGDPWIKADAVMPALHESAADICIVADADVWCEELPAAVEAVEAGAPWAMPHANVFRLDEAASARYMSGEGFRNSELTQRPYRGVLGGGYVVARRQALIEIPLDPRFVGWGQEDLSWAAALSTLAGERWRGAAPLIHLWHPPQKRLSRKIGSRRGQALWTRYRSAHGDREAMAALIEEIDRGTNQPRMHDPSSD